ncbi:integrase, catalytic region, zinc finger, CCHC-type containing protein [Tanacetum coccineum]|uniref:Integrase, catalytic region, zinc finger, CCHC-type containing protein n=1 Tax=Tanacetum coccineum TaxID=301880 RepID=A0ABQ4ZTF1_9ASTR
MHSHDHFRAPTAHDMEILIKICLMPLALKTQNDSFTFVHELKQEMHADLKYVESLEKETDELESDKAEFSNMYDILLQKLKECECLAQKLSKQTETVSKEVYTELLRSFAKLEKHSISLELALQQCQEQIKNDTICKEKASNVFLKEREQYFEKQDLKAQLQDKNIAINYTWTLFLRSKDETPEVLKDFLKMIQRNLQAQAITVRTDRGTKFLNKALHAYFKEEGIENQTSIPRTPEQNGIVERQNRTLVEAARTMLLAYKLPLFFWAEAITTACYT